MPQRRRGQATGVKRLCEDCGDRAAWEITSTRDATVDPPSATTTWACDAHRADVEERLLSLDGNATVVEVLG